MSARLQVERMSADHFQNWVQSQIKSATGNRFKAPDQSSLQQCDQMLQEWGQHRQQMDQYEEAFRDSTIAQRGLRKRLMSALQELQSPKEGSLRQTSLPAPRTTRSQPIRRASFTSTRTAVPAPQSAPIVQVLAPALGQQIITFAYSGRRGSQPNGSSGVEVYISLNEIAPTSDSDFRFAAWATRSPHLMQFCVEDVGRTAHYRLRWINAKGETGPWSEIASAVIPGMSELALN